MLTGQNYGPAGSGASARPFIVPAVLSVDEFILQHDDLRGRDADADELADLLTERAQTTPVACLNVCDALRLLRAFVPNPPDESYCAHFVLLLHGGRLTGVLWMSGQSTVMTDQEPLLFGHPADARQVMLACLSRPVDKIVVATTRIDEGNEPDFNWEEQEEIRQLKAGFYPFDLVLADYLLLFDSSINFSYKTGTDVTIEHSLIEAHEALPAEYRYYGTLDDDEEAGNESTAA